jgi:tetratricopeptide (TPR) repeat protein
MPNFLNFYYLKTACTENMRTLFYILSLLVSIHGFAQSYEDSTHIADLKRSLATATGTARVDILNDLAYEYQAFGKLRDSAARYQQWAYQEAVKANYKHGMALSLLGLPGSEEEKKSNTLKAIQIANETKDDAVLGWAYYKGSINGELVENYKKSVEYFRTAGLEQDEAEVSTWLTTALIYQGKYEEAFPYAERNLKITKTDRQHNKELQHVLIVTSYMNISELYKIAGDLESAIAYLHRARDYHMQHVKGWWTTNPLLAELYCKVNKPDSAIYYLQNDPPTPIVLLGLAGAHLMKGNRETAITLINRSIDSVTMPRSKPFYRNNDPFLMGAYFVKAKAFASANNYDMALQLLRKSDAHATLNAGNVEEQLDKFNLYAEVYHKLGKYDSAYRYLKKYTVLKDSVDSKKALWQLSLKLNNLQATIVNQKKEADLAIREQMLKQQVFIRNSLIGGLFFLLLIAFFVLRNLQLSRKGEKLRLEQELLQSEQKQSELKREAAELEMQALRAQMNPHFIFNCLSSINRFIVKNDNKVASDYLTKFSRLIRMVLLQSQKKLIPLEDELEMLRLYLDMERMRFKNGFSYSITTNNTIDAGAIFIPPLLLQPFCENAIWHGLMHKEEGNGQLSISITEQDGVLYCSITDNGVGRDKAALYKSKSAEKEKSLGLKITSARLDLLNGNDEKGTSFEIFDLLDDEGKAAGTAVHLKIAYKEFAQEKASYA